MRTEFGEWKRCSKTARYICEITVWNDAGQAFHFRGVKSAVHKHLKGANLISADDRVPTKSDHLLSRLKGKDRENLQALADAGYDGWVWLGIKSDSPMSYEEYEAYMEAACLLHSHDKELTD